MACRSSGQRFGRSRGPGHRASSTLDRQQWRQGSGRLGRMPAENLPDQLDLFQPAASVALLDRGAPSRKQQSSHVIGAEHERALDEAGERKRQGSYYTPPDVVEGLLDLALNPILAARACDGVDAVKAIRVLDPACGSGNFLVAVAARIQQQLEDLGVDALEAAQVAYGQCVSGIDIDNAAVELCRESLIRESGGEVTKSEVVNHVLCTDALDIHEDRTSLLNDTPLTWPEVRELASCSSGYDLVIGNPPFLSQLSSATARTEDYAVRLRERFGDAAAGLTDTAVIFLLLSSDIVAPDLGTVCLIQPISFLSTRDATTARSRLLDTCALRALWICEEKVFNASVRVCAPLLQRGGVTEQVHLYIGRDFHPASASSPTGSTWSGLLATSKGIPDVEVQGAGSVADIATATADFRDQYYGLRGCVVERREACEAEFPRLLTSGLIDPAEILWGSRRTKFDKTAYEYPRVEIARLEPRLQDWAAKRLGPKLVLATQTKVLEAAVDECGTYLPSVPVISVAVNEKDDLWCLGALLTSPPVTLVAARRHLGAALSTEALKLSASDVLNLPLPEDRSVWSVAATHFKRACDSPDAMSRRANLLASGKAMCKAFGLSHCDDLLNWWQERLPRSHRSRH